MKLLSPRLEGTTSAVPKASDTVVEAVGGGGGEVGSLERAEPQTFDVVAQIQQQKHLIPCEFRPITV